MSETQELQIAMEKATRTPIAKRNWEYIGYSVIHGKQRLYYKDELGNYHYRELTESDFKRW